MNSIYALVIVCDRIPDEVIFFSGEGEALLEEERLWQEELDSESDSTAVYEIMIENIEKMLSGMIETFSVFSETVT